MSDQPAGIPATCPDCGTRFRARDRSFALQHKVVMLVLLGILATTAWDAAWYLFSPIIILPQGIGGVVLCFVLYLWPTLLLSSVAVGLRKVMTLRCAKCRWSMTALVGRAATR